MKNKFLSMFDYLLIAISFILVILGVLFIYSSSINQYGISVRTEHKRQLIWFLAGVIAMIFFTIYDYRKCKKISLWFYIGVIFLLIYTLIFGKEVNNAKSWIGIGGFGIQPSEIGKLSFILFLAKFLEDTKSDDSIKRYVFAILLMIPPFTLTLLQPDMGTACVYIAIFLCMTFMSDIPVKYIVFTILFGMFTILFAVLPQLNTEILEQPKRIFYILSNSKLKMILVLTSALITAVGFIVRKYFHGPKYYYWITFIFGIITISLLCSWVLLKVLKPYQLRRLYIFLDPYKDGKKGLGDGWNIIQSKIAIGSGGFKGQGYLNGSQSHGRYLAEQSTDFIFSIYSEEFGFWGGLLIFTLYTTIFVRMIYIIKQTKNAYGTYVGAGILGMYMFHFIINVGMVMGIMPVMGIPLLLLSYGGSSLVTSLIAIGFMMSINYRKKELL